MKEIKFYNFKNFEFDIRFLCKISLGMFCVFRRVWVIQLILMLMMAADLGNGMWEPKNMERWGFQLSLWLKSWLFHFYFLIYLIDILLSVSLILILFFFIMMANHWVEPKGKPHHLKQVTGRSWAGWDHELDLNTQTVIFASLWWCYVCSAQIPFNS